MERPDVGGDEGSRQSPGDEPQGRLACAVDVSPELVDAGASLTLRCTVRCNPVRDLRGHTLSIRDQGGADVAAVELTEYDGEADLTGAVVVTAPVEEGACSWLVLCPAVVNDGVSYPEGSVAASFTVRAHSSTILVWDVPTAIAVGARFRIKVGIKCSSECDHTNRAFGIYDHDGAAVARATLGDRWPDTGLYGAEVELEAPAVEGLFTWSARIAGSAVEMPHTEGSTTFGVRVVRPPRHRVTVEAVDRVTRAPLEGARVVMHPYRTATDARGMAELQVAEGAYTLFVTHRGYFTLGLPVDVSADLSAMAELDVEPVPERY